LLDKARDAGTTIVYDPNFRKTHLSKRDELLRVITENMEYARIIRASDEDLVNIFQVDNPDQAWEYIRPHCPILIYTANARAVHLRSERLSLEFEVERIEPVSTIGAGDTFNAGILYGLWKHGYRGDRIGQLGAALWEDLIREAIRFSREVCLSYENYLSIESAENIKEEYRIWKEEN
jgi:fructokinase